MICYFLATLEKVRQLFITSSGHTDHSCNDSTVHNVVRIEEPLKHVCVAKQKHFKNGTSPASFSITFGLFQTRINIILHQINMKNFHAVCNAGIRTHNLQIASLIPWPLDQGSRPKHIYRPAYHTISKNVCSYFINRWPSIFKHFFRRDHMWWVSVTRKKSPNDDKSCPKMKSLEIL